MEYNKEKTIKHKLGWCSNCGWVHGVVKAHMFIEDGHDIIKTLCPKCREHDKTADRYIICAVCGKIKGGNLYPVTVETLQFDDKHTCNMLIPLCETCRQKPHSEIRTLIKKPDMCGDCPDRFLCYTSTHQEPAESMVDWRRGKFQKNMRDRRRW